MTQLWWTRLARIIRRALAVQRVLGLVSPSARLGWLEEIQHGPPPATPDRVRTGMGADAAARADSDEATGTG
jgi:hypothetical protein